MKRTNLLGDTLSACSATGEPHDWKWYGTLTHQCSGCHAFTWYMNAAMTLEEARNYKPPFRRDIWTSEVEPGE